MKPYYEDSAVTIYHGDALGDSMIRWVECDVLVTDPPYGRSWSQGDTNTARGWRTTTHRGIANDSGTATRDAALAFWDGPAVVFGDLMLAPPSDTKHVLIYDKGDSAGFTGCIGGFRRNAEAVYLLGRGWSSGLGGRSSILRTTESTGGNLARTTGHPHTKPLDVLAVLLSSCPPGVVADPFMGSGSTLVAAKALGRRAIGVEIDERYCEVAARRCGQEVLDLGGVA